MRLSQVHDPVRQGLITAAIQIYRDKGVCGYFGDDLSRFAAVHVQDVARLYRPAIEKTEPNARYHAVSEEGVPMKDIAETIGRHLKMPIKTIPSDEADDYFGWLAMLAWLPVLKPERLLAGSQPGQDCSRILARGSSSVKSPVQCR